MNLIVDIFDIIPFIGKKNVFRYRKEQMCVCKNI